ncbi:hypothetical protein FVEN_g5726 [Fusarium venenatum]|nr:hypothetical protein FVEN_g5726 [Fusarium venenatum]
MAPIGIVTTIVSAIRVSGPPWLKAVIGRSRENLSAAEMELMSSTSQETCELYNGLDVVRCQGLAPVKEIICLLPDHQDVTKDTPIRLTCLEDAGSDLIEKWDVADSHEPEAVKRTRGYVEEKMLSLWPGVWEAGEKSQAEGGLIILGQQTEELSWALRWWLPPDAPMPLEIDEEAASLGKYEESQVAGTGEIGRGLKDLIVNNSTSTQPDDSETSPKLEQTESEKHGKRPKSLAIQSHNSLERLYAKHMFHTFIWDAVAALNKPIWQGLGIESFGTLDS